jgi:chromosome segregation ATPase
MYKKFIDRIKIIEKERKILSLRWHVIIYRWIARKKNQSQYFIENPNSKFKSVILLLDVMTVPLLNQGF